MDFSRSKKEVLAETPVVPTAQGGNDSYLGKTLKIKGSITSDESVTVEGKVTGNITSDTSITIGESGNVSGTLEADYVNVLGKAKGIIKSKQRMIIKTNARFEGEINSGSVIIEEGGVFNGNMNMSDKKNR